MREHEKKRAAGSCELQYLLPEDRTPHGKNRWVILPWLSPTTGWKKKLSQHWGLSMKYIYMTFPLIGSKRLYMLRDYKEKRDALMAWRESFFHFPSVPKWSVCQGPELNLSLGTCDIYSKYILHTFYINWTQKTTCFYCLWLYWPRNEK